MILRHRFHYVMYQISLSTRYPHSFIPDSIYCIGGFAGNETYSHCYKYEVHANSWTELPPMPEKRSYCSGAVLARKIYVIGQCQPGFSWSFCGLNARLTKIEIVCFIGGLSASGTDTPICHVFNVDGMVWGKVANMSSPRSKFRAIPIAGKIYCVGRWSISSKVSCDLLLDDAVSFCNESFFVW